MPEKKAISEPRSDKCRGPRCGRQIYWQQSPKTGRWIPYDDPDGRVSHWATCVDSQYFRKKKKSAPVKTAGV